MFNPLTAIFKWDVTFCRYGIDIDTKAQGSVKTLWNDNWLKDADGNEIASFYTGFGAAWGSGSSGMGGPNPKGSRLPKTMRLTYYDFLEDRFYQLDAELPLHRLYDLFSQRTVDKTLKYGEVRPRFDDLRIGVATQGHVMVWAAGVANLIELQTYQARELKGLTRKSYNASLPGGTFTLMEDRDLALFKGGRMQPETIKRIQEGWVPSPTWYMRTARVTYPWRHRLTGNVLQVTEIESYQGNPGAQSVGYWEMDIYNTGTAMRGVPETAKFWFIDLKRQRHHLWLSFYLRPRAVAEADLSEVRAAFATMFPGRQLEDNAYWPGQDEMASVEVHITEDFKNITASLVKGTMRLPLPVGKTQHFELEPYTHWPGDTSESVTPEMRKLFQYGPSTWPKS